MTKQEMIDLIRRLRPDEDDSAEARLYTIESVLCEVITRLRETENRVVVLETGRTQ